MTLHQRLVKVTGLAARRQRLQLAAVGLYLTIHENVERRQDGLGRRHAQLEHAFEQVVAAVAMIGRNPQQFVAAPVAGGHEGIVNAR